jgi:hypothetical protein
MFNNEPEALQTSTLFAVDIGEDHLFRIDDEPGMNDLVPQSSRLFSKSSAKREISPEHKPEKTQEVAASEPDEIIPRALQESIGKETTNWFKNSYLTEEDLQDLCNVGNDVEQLIRTGFEFAELEKSLFNISLTPFREGFRANDFPIREGIKAEDPPLEGGKGGGNEQNYVRAHEEEPVSPWNRESHISVKGLRELSRFLESEQHQENASASMKPFDPKEAATLEESVIPSGESSFSFKKHKGALEAELYRNEDREDAKQSSDVSEIDLNLILEAVAQKIYREYTRFYGR